MTPAAEVTENAIGRLSMAATDWVVQVATGATTGATGTAIAYVIDMGLYTGIFAAVTALIA